MSALICLSRGQCTVHVCVLRGNQEAAPSAGFPSFTQWQMVGLQTCPSSSVGPTRKQTRTKSRKHDGRWGGARILSFIRCQHFINDIDAFGRQRFIFNLVKPLGGGAAIVLSMVSPCVLSIQNRKDEAIPHTLLDYTI